MFLLTIAEGISICRESSPQELKCRWNLSYLMIIDMVFSKGTVLPEPE